MAKFKTLKTFRDIHTDQIYQKGAVIEMTVKRAKEVEKNLDNTFLERVEENDEKQKQGDLEGAE